MELATQLELPLPPSANGMYRTYKGRMLISREGLRYFDKVAAITIEARAGGELSRVPLTGRLKMLVTVYPPDRRRRDLDNLLKGLQDALEKARVYVNDAQIDDLHIIRAECCPPDGAVHVRIWTL